MRLRIGIIAPFPPPPGGMSILADTLKESLEENKVLVTGINTNPEVPVVYRTMKISVIYQHFRFYVGLGKILNQQALILISGSGFSFYSKIIPSLLIARLLRKKVILDFVGGGILGKLHRVNVCLLRLFENILVPTAVFENALKEKGVECSVFPHIVRIEKFSNQKTVGHYATLLSAKSLVKYSSVDDLIKAYAIIKRKFPNVTLKIAGDGPEKENLQKLVLELSLTGVDFVGNIPHEKMPELLQSATVLIHGTRVESFGIVLVEAMASGTPIVSTDVGGIPDVIEDGIDGFLVPHGDYESLAKKVLGLLTDHEMYNRIRENGIRKSEKYGPFVLTRDLIERVGNL